MFRILRSWSRVDLGIGHAFDKTIEVLVLKSINEVSDSLARSAAFIALLYSSCKLHVAEIVIFHHLGARATCRGETVPPLLLWPAFALLRICLASIPPYFLGKAEKGLRLTFRPRSLRASFC